MGNLLSAVISLRLFLLKEKSMIYHLGGLDEKNLEGREPMVFRGNQGGISRPPHIIKGGLKKIACQSIANERGTMRIL